MKILYLQKYGDKLLFAIALALMIGALFPFLSNIINSTRREAIITLVFTQWWHDELEEDVLTGLIKEFESHHNGIRVVLDTRSYEDIWQDFFYHRELSFRADVFALDPLWVPELQKKEIIENPSPVLLSFINVLYYNIDILAEAGFSRPPRNRGEFTAYSRAVTNLVRRGLVMEISGPRGAYDDVFPWIWSAGASLTNNGNPALATASFIASLAFLQTLNNEGLILHSAGGKLEDFVLGRAAFMIAPAWIIDYVRKHMGDEAFSITSIPPPDNYAGRTFFASQDWILAINPASEHKDEARLFMDFLVENGSLLSEETVASPPDSIQAISDPLYSKVWEIAMAGQVAGDFAGLPWFELDRLLREELDTLFTGTSTPAQTAAAIQRAWETILRE